EVRYHVAGEAIRAGAAVLFRRHPELADARPGSNAAACARAANEARTVARPAPRHRWRRSRRSCGGYRTARAEVACLRDRRAPPRKLSPLVTAPHRWSPLRAGGDSLVTRRRGDQWQPTIPSDSEPLARFERATYGLRNRITQENPSEFSRS